MDHEAFKAWRLARDWSQELTSRNLGVTLRTVQYWESGTVPIPETVQRLVAAMTEHDQVFVPYEPPPKKGRK